MAEGSERSALIDCPSWTVDTPLRILTQRTNGLPGWWQPDTRPRTITAPLGVMDKRGPINTSIHDGLRLPAASAILPISTALRGCINNGAARSACDFSSVCPCSPNHKAVYVLVIVSTVIMKGEGVEPGEGHSGVIWPPYTHLKWGLAACIHTRSHCFSPG